MLKMTIDRGIAAQTAGLHWWSTAMMVGAAIAHAQMRFLEAKCAEVEKAVLQAFPQGRRR